MVLTMRLDKLKVKINITVALELGQSKVSLKIIKVAITPAAIGIGRP
jgi:hypothetical protein